MKERLNLDESAELLGVTKRTLANYRARRDFPKAIKISRKMIFYKPEELAKWRDSQRG
ncbi:MAG: helix-turn-helix domain-containing protein [Methylobacter sp.]|uniref:helix-turn-helix transcriptional regulator n=1 Tax=Methylobacter sp. TaxID=2051955 RepID=UPI0025DF90BD|nr:helix-turn-helix domain-containing protein [Methylobacter sp.]MCK9622164.1 helix-turn-helix domain-containing protein [Methylobacter sp.]